MLLPGLGHAVQAPGRGLLRARGGVRRGSVRHAGLARPEQGGTAGRAAAGRRGPAGAAASGERGGRPAARRVPGRLLDTGAERGPAAGDARGPAGRPRPAAPFVRAAPGGCRRQGPSGPAGPRLPATRGRHVLTWAVTPRVIAG